MSLPISIQPLHAAYAAGELTPSAVVEQFLAQPKALLAQPIWISRVEDSALRARATALDRLGSDARSALPLYGVPFAVKDNIDVAGMPTTAACPAFAYVPARSATVVEKLKAAGAILVGKTNLDQFATGLVGTRSPYGAVPNAFDPRFISGGSSSGSAVAVAKGLVSFALGTDTAGSGRVPAAFNNIVGLKPSRGLVSARGVVPACQSLDCVSIFALSVADAMAVLESVRGVDTEDPYSRPIEPDPLLPSGPFRCAVPKRTALEFFGDRQAQAAWERALTVAQAIGAQLLEIDFDPLLEAAALLYEGPWVAERMAAIEPFFAEHAAEMDDSVRRIIAGSADYSALDTFKAQTKLAALKQRANALWREADVLLAPTTPTHYTIDQVRAEPLELNRRLGYYTNFVNLLDFAAIAVPGAMRADGLPFGVSLIGPSGADWRLAEIGRRLHRASGVTLGATSVEQGDSQPLTVAGPRMVKVAVVGAHLSGMPLNHQLTNRGAVLLRAARTRACYRLFALPGTAPSKPGLIKVAAVEGYAIDLEIWQMPVAAYGSFVAEIAPPLGIGTLELEDGTQVQGFLCESSALNGAQDISRFGGWRAYLASAVDG